MSSVLGLLELLLELSLPLELLELSSEELLELLSSELLLELSSEELLSSSPQL